LCRKSATKLTSIQSRLAELNIGLVAIGSGTSLMAKSFQKEFAFTGELFVDQKRDIFKFLGCYRGLKYVLNPRTLAAGITASAEGFSQGVTAGDALQLGGVFLISLSKGLLYQRFEEFAGDHPRSNEILEICKKHVPQN